MKRALILAACAALAGCSESCPVPAADEVVYDYFVQPANVVVYDENDCAYLVQLGDAVAYGRRPVRWAGRLPYSDRHPQTGPKQNCIALIRR